MAVNFKYQPGDILVNPFGVTVIVTICSYSVSGNTYLCMTETGQYITFAEELLMPVKERKNNVVDLNRN